MKSEGFGYTTLLRWVAILAGVVMWLISVRFSADGFGFTAGDGGNILGIALAAVFTVVELVWNRGGFHNNWTISLFGLLAYVYGVGTNVVGLGVYMAINFKDPWSEPIKLGFAVLLGLMVEILAEPMVVWGAVGRISDDFLSNFLGSVAEEETWANSIFRLRNGERQHRPLNTLGGHNNQQQRGGQQHQQKPQSQGYRPAPAYQEPQFFQPNLGAAPRGRDDLRSERL